MNYTDTSPKSIREELLKITQKLNAEWLESGGLTSVTGKNFHLEFTCKPDWIGLEFKTINLDKSDSFEWRADTDNYPISEDEHKWLKESTANEILFFLKALQNGDILVSRNRRGVVTIIPDDEGYYKTNKMIIGEIRMHYKDLKRAKGELEFTSFVLD